MISARLALSLSFLLCACGNTARPGGDGGRVDGGRLDGGSDLGPYDSGGDTPPDIGIDSPTSDLGADAATADAGRDAGSVDAGHDAGVTDAGPRVDAGTTTIECVPVVPPNELNSGIVLSPGFWSGFRFQITSARTATSIGLNVQNEGAAGGTVFGAIIALTDMSDMPDSAALTTSDVLVTTTFALGAPGASHTVSGTISTALAPGWYAVMFGLGAFGATGTSGSIHSNSGGGGCTSGGGYPFTIRQSDGMFILQGATPNFFIVTSP